MTIGGQVEQNGDSGTYHRRGSEGGAPSFIPAVIEPAAFGLPVYCSTRRAREDVSSHA